MYEKSRILFDTTSLIIFIELPEELPYLSKRSLVEKRRGVSTSIKSWILDNVIQEFHSWVMSHHYHALQIRKCTRQKNKVCKIKLGRFYTLGIF